MNTASAFLFHILVVLLDRIIFSRCAELNSSSSGIASSISPSLSLCSDCAPSTVQPRNQISFISSKKRSIYLETDTKYLSSSLVMMTSVVSPTKTLVFHTTKPVRQPLPAPQLTSFGIFLITFGGVLIVCMIIALVWICCGRERSPEAPHPQVKLKPWSHSPPEQSVNDAATEISDLPNSYQNQGLNSSSPISPFTQNTNTGRITENFR
ncbi:uncharacterized protein LOC111320572 isoform X2 [Stylophora pistillata]|uniref:Uncharacterized protein n=2 Tax=Stylophora pistillata TaxID=50429 RepID=A0A2B4SUD4_STYPI|nr:uncharacterized protein LOC111320572 isoform X2 [Stylophora pistillata]PFX32693.1 hypothetical protein AWC38_SpisGene2502 [Stylophora pistillata]